ncbi:hypothetical protein BJ878DRAFT_62907 [Calycina marina]|uniref:Phosphatidate phosphatase APP1 catalytic domain-containing protein n=1 Tax=Calycina marina TaxID=1763456 RepID=A0A9P8CK82_9HELO|nr:hypothetical protein BJ878DRAFT_62907 [Calycina marina]
MSGLLSSAGGNGGERGSRRKKLAGYLTAANEIRQSYQKSAAERWNAQDEVEHDDTTIPGSFPDVAIVSHGDEQLILFPSYARNHIKEEPSPDRQNAESLDSDSEEQAEYWAREWQRFENDSAIVDVDVKGWIYSPHRGPISRKNRVLIGLARKLSGIPAPKTPERTESPERGLRAGHREREAQREQENISLEAEKILLKGTEEERFAAQGAYSENPKDDSDLESIRSRRTSATPSLVDPPGPGFLAKRKSWNHPDDMSPSELLTANSHLMTRLKPFMTNPLVSTPVTVFFYDEKTSVSKIVKTNESGHFVLRASLDFVPTHVRVLASERLSATEEVKVTQPKGVSVISDVDDTIKHSSIGSGAREIFRNAFIRELADLTIEGVKEWYNTMYDMGVGFHFVSNSPWQLFPVLVSFFQIAGLPPGSYHLKQYTGMLQGIFEPVAERKKGTLTKIMKDFPERRFILIGDSGEADLEVYTDIALAHPGMVLAIFIRDVTTPVNSFFDSSMGPLAVDRSGRRNVPGRSFSLDEINKPEARPNLPSRILTEMKPQTSTGPSIGKLIDVDDEPEEMSVHESHRRVLPRSSSDLDITTAPRKSSNAGVVGRAPPPRPAKPVALRGLSKAVDYPPSSQHGTPPPPPPSRRPLSQASPLSHEQKAADIKDSNEGYVSSARHKVSTAYNALPEVRSYIPGRGSPDSDQAAPKPPRRTLTNTTANTSKRLSWNSTDTSDDERPANVPVNKKFDLWKRRYKRAKDVLDAKGVTLRTWRAGSDVAHEAVQLVENTMASMGVEGYGKDAGKGKTGEGGGEMKAKDMKRPSGNGNGKMTTKNTDHGSLLD